MDLVHLDALKPGLTHQLLHLGAEQRPKSRHELGWKKKEGTKRRRQCQQKSESEKEK
jgi:hypothetical protein